MMATKHINNVLDNVERNIVPFSLFSSVVSLATMLLALTLFTICGHHDMDDRFFPTISSTEYNPPEKYVYITGFTYCGVALCLTISVVHLRMIAPALKDKRKWAYVMNNVSLGLGLLSGIFFTLQTYWPVEHIMHSSTSGAFFYSGLVYCILVTIVTRTPECRALGFEKMWKGRLCMACAYALFVGFFGLGLLDSYANRKTFVYYYVETLSEWGAVYAFILNFATFGFDCREYKRIMKDKAYRKEAEENEGSVQVGKEEEKEGTISGGDIILTALGDGADNAHSLDGKKDGSHCGISSVRRGVEELFTVVISSGEEKVMEQFEAIGEGIGIDSPLIERKFSLLEKIDMIVGASSYKVIPATYASLLAFSVGGFALLRLLF